MPKVNLTPYQRIVQDWKNCQRCPLSTTRKKVVIARGTLPADVLFIGEAPGESEDVIGLPFVGPAGKLLDRIIADAQRLSGRVGLKLAFTNLTGCIPKAEDTHRKRGEPLPSEIEACYPRLEGLIEIARPKLIVAVGQLSDKQSKLGAWGAYATVIAIHHPAYLLRLDIGQRPLACQRVVVQLTDAFEELK